MKCKKIKEIILTDYADGNLRGRILESVKAHIESCPGCRSLAEEAMRLGKRFKSAVKEEPPARVWHKIHAEIGKGSSWRVPAGDLLENLRYALMRLRPAAVVAAAAVVTLFILASLRFTYIESRYQSRFSEDDILAADYSNGDAVETVYDLGTPAEEYFL